MTAVPALSKPKKPPARRLQLRRGDHEFLPAALEILETPLSPIRSTVILTICAFAVAALTWAYVGKVDIIAVAQGKIQPIGRTKTVQPIETGKVLNIAVENGARVRAGDLLLELDPSESRADEATFTADLRAMRAESLRRSAALQVAYSHNLAAVPEVAWDPDIPALVAAREGRVLRSDLEQLRSSIASLDAQAREKLAERNRLQSTITAQEQLIATLKERVDMRSTLLDKDAGSKAAVIDAKELYQTQQATLAAERGQLGEAEAGTLKFQREAEKSVSSFIAENSQKLAEAERQVDETAEKLAKAQIKTSHMVLRSPIDGIVQGLTVTTVGQVVTTGEQILQIVPNGAQLEIECYLPNGDVGFVKPGQPAVIKVGSFPFTDYGTIDATVTRVAEDAVPQVDAEQREQNPAQPVKDASMFGGVQRTQNLVFPVTLALGKPEIDVGDTKVPLVPGMAVTVEVKTGKRRILSYLFSPLVTVATTAMRER